MPDTKQTSNIDIIVAKIGLAAMVVVALIGGISTLSVTYIENKRSALEQERNLTLKVYDELQNMLETSSTRQDTLPLDKKQLLVSILLDNLSEENPSKEQLKTFMSEYTRFSADQATVDSQSKAVIASAPPVAINKYTKAPQKSKPAYLIDVFYVGPAVNAAQEKAATVQAALKNSPELSKQTQVRLRLLPDFVNNTSAYNIQSNEIRYDSPEEQSLVKAVLKQDAVLQEHQFKLTFVPAKNKTPNYISFFIYDRPKAVKN